MSPYRVIEKREDASGSYARVVRSSHEDGGTYGRVVRRDPNMAISDRGGYGRIVKRKTLDSVRNPTTSFNPGYRGSGVGTNFGKGW